eukprot:3271984-Amphidinium_carterae.1
MQNNQSLKLDPRKGCKVRSVLQAAALPRLPDALLQHLCSKGENCLCIGRRKQYKWEGNPQLMRNNMLSRSNGSLMSGGRIEAERQMRESFIVRKDTTAGAFGKESEASQLLTVWEAAGAGKTTFLATLPDLLADSLQQEVTNITVVPVTYNQWMSGILRSSDVESAVVLRMGWATLRCMGGEPEECGLRFFSSIDDWRGGRLKVTELVADALPTWYPPPKEGSRSKRTILVTVDEVSKVKAGEGQCSLKPEQQENAVRETFSGLLDDAQFRHVFVCFSALSRDWRTAVLGVDGRTKSSGRITNHIQLTLPSMEYVVEVLQDQLQVELSLSREVRGNLVLIAAATGAWPRVVWRIVQWLKNKVGSDPTVLTNSNLGYREVWLEVKSITEQLAGTNLARPPLVSEVDEVLRSGASGFSFVEDALADWAPVVNNVRDLVQAGSLVVEMLSDSSYKLDIPCWCAVRFLQEQSPMTNKFPLVSKFLEIFQIGGNPETPSVRGK